jgi:2-polyprenyl-3-methyl-5-hydroxy-6-metoxy-1,4-benzoquinol methylase
MPNQSSLKKIYDTLVSKGYDMEPEQEFYHNMDSPDSRRRVYDALKQEGYNLRPYDDFYARMGYGQQPQQTEVQGTPTPQGASPAMLFAQQARDDRRETVSEHAEQRKAKTQSAQTKPQQAPAKPRAPELPPEEEEEQSPYGPLADQMLNGKTPQEQARELMTGQSAQPTAEQRAWMWQQVEQLKQQVKQQSASVDQQLSQAREYVERSAGNAAGIQGKAVRGNIEYNPLTGEMEQAYITPTGYKTFDKNQADAEARDYRYSMPRDVNYMASKIGDIKSDIESKIDSIYAEKDNPYSMIEMAYGNTHTAVNDPDVLNYHAALSSLNNAQQLWEEAKKEKNESWYNPSSLGRGVAHKLFDVRTWDFGITDAVDMSRLKAAINKADAGEDLTESEQMLLDAKAIEMAITAAKQSDVGFGYEMGSTIGELVPMLLEMYINPAAGVGKSAQSKLLRFAMKRFGKTALVNSPRMLRFGLGTARVLGDITGAGIMTGTTSLGRTYADAMQREIGQIQYGPAQGGTIQYTGHSDGESAGKSFAKAYGAKTAEWVGLMAGGWFKPVEAAAGEAIANTTRKMGLGAVNDFMANLSDKEYMQILGDLGKRSGLMTDFSIKEGGNGTLNNVLGIKVGEAMNALTVGDITMDKDPDTGYFNFKRNLNTLLSFAALDGMMNVHKVLSYRTPKYQAKLDIDRASHAASLAFGDPKKWEVVKTGLLGGTLFRDLFAYRQGAQLLRDERARWRENGYYDGGDVPTDRWDELEKMLDDGRNGTGEAGVAYKALEDILTNKDYDAFQRRAALQYIMAVIRYESMVHGERMRSQRAPEPGVVDPQRRLEQGDDPLLSQGDDPLLLQAADEYEAGREQWQARQEGAEGAAQQVDATSDRMQTAIDQLVQAYGPDAEAIVDMVEQRPQYVIQTAKDDAQRAAAMAYLNAKAAMDGITDAANEQAEERRMQVEHDIRLRTYKMTGQLQPATLKAGDAEVFIIDGRISASQDGMGIDVDLSDDTIIVYNPESDSYEMMSPDQLLKLSDPVNAEQAIAEAQQQIDAELQASLQPSKYKRGEITLRGEDGQEHFALVTGDKDADGNIQVYISDGNGNAGHLEYFTEQQLDDLAVNYTPDEAQPAAESSADGTAPSAPEAPTEPVPAVPEVPPTQPEPQSALSRVPRSEKGEPLYEQADAATGWDALVEDMGSADAAKEVADAQVEQYEKRLKNITSNRKKLKGTPAEMKAQREQREALQHQTETTLEAWKKIAGEQERRRVAEDTQRQQEARKAAEEKAAAEQAERAAREQREREELEALNGVPEMAVDRPADARARGYRRVGQQKVERQAPITQKVEGAAVQIKFSQEDSPAGHVTVIEADQLQPSHIQGHRNPYYFINEAQPKDRVDAASVTSAQKIAGNINPEEITGSITAYTGAPVVNSRGEVIQGNNRSDALRLMYDNNDENAARYKQYLLENAERLGLDPEQIRAMKRPVLVNMLEADDAEAIRLGQFGAQDTESGGRERIKPEATVQKLGDKMSNFVSMLLRGEDDEGFAQLVDRNGVDVIKWMARQGIISQTQAQSAFTTDGNLAPEAQNDLRDVLYQSIFQGAPTRAKEMFAKLPAKAQKAILSTAYRDYDSPAADRLLTELQNSITAYNDLMTDESFAASTDVQSALAAIRGWGRQLSLGDTEAQSVNPSEKYSNFALRLAALYRGEKQSSIQKVFNDLYDTIQGKGEDSLFGEADHTMHTLPEAIKKIFNIDYNGKTGSNLLGDAVPSVPEGRRGGDAANRGGGAVPQGEQPAEPAGRTDSVRRDGGSQADASQIVQGDIRPVGSGFFGEIFDQFKGRVNDAIKFISSHKSGDLLGVFSRRGVGSIDLVWGDEKGGWNHIVQKHVGEGKSFATETEAANVIDEIIKTGSVDFENGDKIVLRKGNKVVTIRKNVREKGKKIADKKWILTAYDESSADSSTSAIAATNRGQAAPTTENHGGKGTAKNTESQGVEGNLTQSSPAEAVHAAEQMVNTEPTDAQKEAGNYRKGHVRVAGYDITIENPAGSTRSGKDANGREWTQTMHNTYGYFRGTEGTDGDHIDVFLGDMGKWQGEGRNVYVVDQYNEDGTFDEHKVMMGFNSLEEAKAAYLSNYEEGWADRRRIDVTGVPAEEFDAWVKSSHRKTKAFAEYKSIKAETEPGTDYLTEEAYDKYEKQYVAEAKERYTRQADTDATPEILAGKSDEWLQQRIEAYEQDGYSLVDGEYLFDNFFSWDNYPTKEQLRQTADHAVERYVYLPRLYAEQVRRKTEDAFQAAKRVATQPIIPKKAKSVNLADYVAPKDEPHPSIRGVYYSGGKAYATDRVILVEEKQKYPKAYEGTVRGKDGNPVDIGQEHFPDPAKAFDIASQYVFAPVDVEEMRRNLARALEAQKAMGKKQQVAVEVASNGQVGYFDATRLKRFLDLVDTAEGDVKVEVGGRGYISLQAKGRRALLLGVGIDKEASCYVVRDEVVWRPNEPYRMDESSRETISNKLGNSATLKPAERASLEYRLSLADNPVFMPRRDKAPVQLKAPAADQAADLTRTKEPQQLSQVTTSGRRLFEQVAQSLGVPTEELRSMTYDQVTAAFDKKYASKEEVMAFGRLNLLGNIHDALGDREATISNYTENTTDGVVTYDVTVDGVTKTLGYDISRNKFVDLTQSDGGDGLLFRMANDKNDFVQMRDEAVKSNGLVMPGLNEGHVRVVPVPRHQFTGTGKDAIKAAGEWAKEHIVGSYTATDSAGVPFTFAITAESVGKYLSATATTKSENLGVHLAVLQKLPEVISNGIEVEVHPSYKKGSDGMRSQGNGIDRDRLVHRFYSAVNIDGEIRRVKTTMIEFEESSTAKHPHSFEVTKIEVLPETSENTSITGAQRIPTAMAGTTEAAKLLQGVEKSYDKGVKVLEVSEKSGGSDEIADIISRARADGSYMKAPNGKPTRLTERQWAQVRTPQFKAWFGDWEKGEASSKVLDENGEPLVVYHGTTAYEERRTWNEQKKEYDTESSPFTVFKRRVDGLRNAGFFFNSNLDNAGGYGYNTYDTYLDLRNPLIIDCHGDNYSSIRFDGREMDTYGWAEYAEKNGYDGLILQNVRDGVGYGDLQQPTTDYVAFKPTQIKSATDNNGAFSRGSSDIRFRPGTSDSQRVQPTLIGVHGITEEKLVKALAAGGLANPSVAVIDADKSQHNDYGEISLILPSGMVDKATGRNAGTWTGDAWTPRYPQTEYQFSDAGSHQLSLDLKSLDAEMRSSARIAIQNWMDGRGTNGLEYMFLQQSGREPEVKQIPVRFQKSTHEAVEQLCGDKRIDFYSIDKSDYSKLLDLYVAEKYRGDKSLYDEALAERKAALERKLSKDISPVFKRIYQEKLDFINEHGFDDSVEEFVSEVARDMENGGHTDVKATDNAAAETVKQQGLEKEFAQWIEGFKKRYGAKEVIFNGFNSRGDRIYLPNTVANASRIMNAQGKNGATGWSTSFSNFVATVMKSIPHLDDMRAEKSRLTTDHQQLDAFDEKWQQVYYDLAQKCQPDARSTFDDFGFARLDEAALKKNPAAYLKKEYGVTLTADDIKQLKQMIHAIRDERPAMYFETKFNRPVRFNEFTAAVVPDDLTPEIREQLEKAGLRVVTYKRGDDATRQQAVQRASMDEGIRFRWIGERGASELDKTSEIKTRISNLDVARQMEQAGKDAYDIKFATGWERGADGKWRYEQPDFDLITAQEYDELRRQQMKGYNEIAKLMTLGDRHLYFLYQEYDALPRRGRNEEQKAKAKDLLKQIKQQIAANNSLRDDLDIQRENARVMSLSDLVHDANGLFDAYPVLANVEVEFKALFGLRGQMECRNGIPYRIEINSGMDGRQTRSTLIHEVQHAIQDLEGFARGGNSEMYVEKSKIPGFVERVNQIDERLNELDAQSEALIDRRNSEYEQLRQQWEAATTPQERSSIRDAWTKRENEIIEEANKVDEERARLQEERDEYAEGSVQLGYYGYSDLAGEVEARNAQTRMDYTPEDRLYSPAFESEDVSRKSQIFLNQTGGHSASTSGQIEQKYPGWNEGTTTESGKHTTQVEGTRKTYGHVGDWIEQHIGKEASILDASSGLGYGTADLRGRGFNVEDVEPYQSEQRRREMPATYDDYSKIDKQYDYVISNAVLNVIPDDWRADVLHQMARVLKPGGQMFINTRKAGEERTIKDKIELDNPQEVLVKRNGKIASYQKFFTPTELKEWVEKELGPGYQVEIANEANSGTRGLPAVVVTKWTRASHPGEVTQAERVLSEVNKKFNEELEMQIKGTLPANHVYELGHPGDVLQVAGVRDLPIQLYANRLALKASPEYRRNHPFELSDIKDLPQALNHPIAVFDSATVKGATVVLTELQSNGKNFVVAMSVLTNADGKAIAAEINDVRSIYPKDRATGVAGWINRGYMRWVDKEKMNSFLSTHPSNPGISRKEAEKTPNGVEVGSASELSSAAKVVESFENPTLPGAENFTRVQKSDHSTLISDKIAVVNDCAKATGLRIRVVEDVTELEAYKKASPEEQARMREGKGWYDPKTGEIVVVPGNHADVGDVRETLRHEIIGHKTLREMVGAERMNDFLDEVYRHMTDEVRQRVVDMAFGRRLNIREATEEYLAGLAEKGFDAMTEKERSLWGKIKAFVGKLINRFLRTLHLPDIIELGDRELRWILRYGWEKSADNPINRRADLPDVVRTARETTLRAETGQDGLRFRTTFDPSDNLRTVTTRAALDLSQRHQDNLQLRSDAYHAISQQLGGLRRAMAAQRTFDKASVQEMTDLAQALLEANMMQGTTNGEIKRILSAIKNATGRTDITEQVHTVLSILIDNQLRTQQRTFEHLLKTRDTRLNQQGVRTQGALDIKGQRMIKTLRNALEIDEASLESQLQDAIDKLSSTDPVVAEQAANDYEALSYAKRYLEVFKKNKADETSLRADLHQAEADHTAGNLTDSAYKQLVEQINNAIEQKRLERSDGLLQLNDDIRQSLEGSRSAARDWRQREVDRINNIHHMANADLQGLPYDEHRTPDFAEKVLNSAPVRLLTSTLPTFDAFLKLFSPKAAGGEGFMYNHFMRSYVESCERERQGVNESFRVLDEKAAEIFGKGKTWHQVALDARRMKLANGKTEHTISIWSGGGMKDYKVTSSELLYIYMVNKMEDGKMKLRRMGIEDDDVNAIQQALDPRLIEMADWLQDEFLPRSRERYNETHQRMFGASMAAIDNYVPLKILKESLQRDVDIAAPDKGDQRSSTVTGSVISRTVNCQPIDILHGDAFNVITSHVTDMEHWAAFSEFARDLNTLCSYNRFRNKVRNMHSVMGAGEDLLRKFQTTCAIATGDYQAPSRGLLDQYALNLAKLGSTAKVSFRLYTAFKQLSSMPAFWPETNPIDFTKSAATPWKSWKWCMENLPMFEKRWAGRNAGNEKMLPTDLDWSWTRDNIVETATRWGLTPNAFVDALTVAIGSKSVYDTHLRRYLDYGYERAEAERRARQDASILFNKTQQSSEGAFMSEMQKSRTWLSTMFTVYRNSPISYQRMLLDASRNLFKRFVPGFKKEAIQQLERQYQWDGLSDADAARAAKKEYNRLFWRDLTNVATFGFVMQIAWNIFGKLPGLAIPLLFSGTDEDDRKKTMQDELIHAAIGGQVEGLTGGDIISDGLTSLVTSGELSDITKDMPMTQDIDNVVREFGIDCYAALNDLLNTMISASIGVNPATFTDAVVAIYDACQGDMPTIREATLCLARIAQVPQSQLDQIYFEEMGCMGDEARKLTPAEVAERYARYKVIKGAPLTHWLYDDEVLAKRMQSRTKQAVTELKGQLQRSYTDEVNAGYDAAEETYKQMAQRIKQYKAQYEECTTDAEREQVSRDMAALTSAPEYATYQSFKLYNKYLQRMAKGYLEAKSADEAARYLDGLHYFKPKMVEAVQATDPAEANRLATELAQWYSDFVQQGQTQAQGSVQH